MAIILNHEESKRLEEINSALNWRFFVAVKEHFNAAGKLQNFADAPTEEEKAWQNKVMRESLKDDLVAAVRNKDIFAGVARRVGTDAELAALLPDTIGSKDAELLEKCQFKELAALARAKP